MIRIMTFKFKILAAVIALFPMSAVALEPICGEFNFSQGQIHQILSEVNSRKDLRIKASEKTVKREIFLERLKNPMKFIERLNRQEDDQSQSYREEVHEALLEKGRKVGGFDLKNYKVTELDQASVVKARQIAKYVLFSNATKQNNWEMLSLSIFNSWGTPSIDEFKFYMASKLQDELFYFPKKVRSGKQFYYKFPDTDEVFVRIDKSNIGHGTYCLGADSRNDRNPLIKGAEKIHSEDKDLGSSTDSGNSPSGNADKSPTESDDFEQ